MDLEKHAESYSEEDAGKFLVANGTYGNGSGSKATRGPFTQLVKLEEWLDHKLGIESHAVERNPPENREPIKWYTVLHMAFFWASGVLNLSSFTTGFLGRAYGLDLKQSLVCIFFGNLVGAAVTSYCATFGAATGLRQMSVSRYSFGWYFNMIPALLNTIQQIGWSAVMCITGGLAIEAVSRGSVSAIPGIVIVAVVSLILCIFGLRAILYVERYVWLLYLLVLLAVMGEAGRFADNHTPAKAKGVTNLAGAVLSFLSTVYGWTASWSPLASDYYVTYPANVSRLKVFIFSSLGLCIPVSVGMWAGAIMASTMDTNPNWASLYEEKGFAFLMMEILYPASFAKFILVILVIAGISSNCMSTYSAPISFLQVSPYVAYIPRLIWQLVAFGIIIALSIAGRTDLEEYLEDFLALLGYWCTCYATIIFLEHVIFRKANFANYDLDGYNDPKRLPYGLAAGITFLVGVVCWVMGMKTTWYVGPLANLFGEFPGDLAMEFTFVFTLVAYPPLRYTELKCFGK